MYDRRGSLWHKWDLHVHTPASLVHNYPGSNDEAWTHFLEDLESLPSTFRSIGVNDYFFIDGYERLIEERGRGRLANLELILPVIELRLNLFGGSRSTLRRVNAHVIFSEELQPDVIRDQFIRALASKFRLAPRYAGMEDAWSGVLARDALRGLGQAIIDSVPKNEGVHFGSALEVGFANLTISLDQIQAVRDTSYLRGRTLLGVGKTEWADVKWSSGSIADKKHVINSCDVVFTAAETAHAYQRARAALRDADVNDHLLDCSDAHYLSASPEKDRIGNADTWVKAALTFGGLRQALTEFDQRVFVGAEPPELTRVREHPSRYIDRVRIQKVPDGGFAERWFDIDLPINAGLVAIIGNRGSGKSALAECVALAGRSQREEDFSFLNETKFREPRLNPARHFETAVLWHDGEETTCLLADSPEPGATPLVQHLPQKYLEKLCNEVPRGEKTDFDRELERIIFAHLPTEDRMGAASLDERVRLGGRARDAELKECRETLGTLNEEIAQLEEQSQEAHVKAVEEAYEVLRREWYELRSSPPDEVEKPSEEDPERAATLNRIRELSLAARHLEGLRDETRTELAAVRRLTASLAGFRAELERLQEEHRELLMANRELLETVGLDEKISSFTVERDVLDEAQAALGEREAALSNHLAEGKDRSFPSALQSVRDQVETLRQQLSAPAERYEEYLERHETWEAEVRSLVGDRDAPDSLLGRRAARERLRTIPAELDAARSQRLSLCRRIHALLLAEAADYAALYDPLERHMRDQGIPSEYRLSVETSLVDAGFTEGFLEDRIHRHVAGSFCGVDESLQVVGSLLDVTDFNDTDSLVTFVGAIDERLHFDCRRPERPAVNPAGQVKKGRTVAELYDYIFGLRYLSPRYALKFGNKPIHLLSPGEKGVLLLIFFLLAETNTRPLIIDQPEDNLDNQTVFKALVQCFHRAKARRQVIIVTHNPNLAVVCDADQVIVAAMDKDEGNEVRYEAGAIEEPRISKAIVDILEGTRPAFDNRSEKYRLHAAEGV